MMWFVYQLISIWGFGKQYILLFAKSLNRLYIIKISFEAKEVLALHPLAWCHTPHQMSVIFMDTINIKLSNKKYRSMAFWRFSKRDRN